MREWTLEWAAESSLSLFSFSGYQSGERKDEIWKCLRKDKKEINKIIKKIWSSFAGIEGGTESRERGKSRERENERHDYSDELSLLAAITSGWLVFLAGTGVTTWETEEIKERSEVALGALALTCAWARINILAWHLNPSERISGFARRMQPPPIILA